VPQGPARWVFQQGACAACLRLAFSIHSHSKTQSQEKYSAEGYNLSCILTFPHHQRKGYGRLLIDFSYELSKIEGKLGSPERPLSDLGLAGYRSYWQSTILDILSHHTASTPLAIRDLSMLTSIREEDIISTLSSLDMLSFWRGEGMVSVTQAMVEAYIAQHRIKMDKAVDPACIRFVPFGGDAS
jgi:histone acetyltransferase MYST1